MPLGAQRAGLEENTSVRVSVSAPSLSTDSEADEITRAWLHAIAIARGLEAAVPYVLAICVT